MDRTASFQGGGLAERRKEGDLSPSDASTRRVKREPKGSSIGDKLRERSLGLPSLEVVCDFGWKMEKGGKRMDLGGETGRE